MSPRDEYPKVGGVEVGGVEPEVMRRIQDRHDELTRAVAQLGGMLVALTERVERLERERRP